jgi:hypothetical protein
LKITCSWLFLFFPFSSVLSKSILSVVVAMCSVIKI